MYCIFVLIFITICLILANVPHVSYLKNWAIKNNIGKPCLTPTGSGFGKPIKSIGKKHDRNGCERCLIYVKRSVSVIANKHIHIQKNNK